MIRFILVGFYSYHSGPLKEEEINWINNPERKPISDRGLDLSYKEVQKKSIKNIAPASYSVEMLKRLKSQIEKYADKTKTLIAGSNSGEYIPLLSITIEPRPFKNKNFNIIGPYIFDLTNRINPEDYNIQSNNWKPVRNQFYKIVKPKRSIKKSIYQVINHSQTNLKKKLYKSKIIDSIQEEKAEVINSNYNFMKEELISATRVLMEKSRRSEEKILKILEANQIKLNSAKSHIRRIKAGRLIRKIFGNKRLSDKTIKIKKLEITIRRLKKKRKLIMLKIKKNKNKTQERIKDLESKLYRKSHTLTNSVVYNPSRKDLIVHANILLYPVENIRKYIS